MNNISEQTIKTLFVKLYENNQTVEQAVVTICKQLELNSFGEFARVYRICNNTVTEKETT